MGVLLELRKVTREYRMGEVTVHALRGVDLDIDAGQVVVRLGPSGSGKTTLLNLVGGLDSPTSGEVLVGGEAIAGYDARRLADYRARTVGFVFQFFNLVPTLTALENVQLLAEVTGLAAERRSRDALGRVGLADVADRFPGEMSGGQQQRVAIARALVNEPALVLADEPTGALDSRTSIEIMGILQDLNREGMTVVLVTHEPDISRYAGRVLNFRDGRITTDEPIVDPTDARTALLSMPSIEPAEEEEHV